MKHDKKVLDMVPGLLVWFAFASLLITWVAETVFSARWDKRYFSVGVPLFVLLVPVKAHRAKIPSCQLLESSFKSNGLIRNTSLFFKELDTNTLGFRESLLQLGRWFSIMHGSLIFDYENNQVIVKGFLDWTYLCYLLLLLIIVPLIWFLGYIPLDEPIWFVALGYFGFLLAITGIFCLIDYFRFLRVGKFAAQAWAQ